MTRRLDLTQSQQSQILPILQKEAGTIKTVKGDTSLSKEQKRKEIRASFKSTHGQVFALLTPGQKAKLRLMHHGKQGGNAPDPGAGAASTPAS